jgi:hypothetical protein
MFPIISRGLPTESQHLQSSPLLPTTNSFDQTAVHGVPIGLAKDAVEKPYSLANALN